MIMAYVYNLLHGCKTEFWDILLLFRLVEAQFDHAKTFGFDTQ